MYCAKCGAQNDDNAFKCVQCGEVLQQARGPVTPVAIPNYLVQSILITLCCCLPFGIVAIIYAAQVNTKANAGDLQGALDYSGKAKMWCWIGFGVGFVANIIIFAFQVFAILATHHH